MAPPLALARRVKLAEAESVRLKRLLAELGG